MKIRHLREVIDYYDTRRGIFSRDPKGISEVRKIVQEHIKDKDDNSLTAQEEIKIISILMNVKQEPHNPNASNAYDNLKQKGGPVANTMLGLYYHEDLFNENNFLKIKDIPERYQYSLSNAWDKLRTNHTQEVLDLLVNNAAFLGTKNDFEFEFKSVEEIKAIIKKNMIETFEDVAAKKGILNTVPKELLTEKNLKNLITLGKFTGKNATTEIPAESLDYYYISSFSDKWALATKAEQIVDALNHLPAKFETQAVFDVLIELLPNHGSLSVTVEAFAKLPANFQNIINLELLAFIELPASVVTGFNELDVLYKTGDNFTYLVNTAANSSSKDIFDYVLTAWRNLPPLLLNQENFEKLNYSEKDKCANTLLIANLFNQLPNVPDDLKTQDNLDTLLKLEINTSRAYILQTIPLPYPVTQAVFDKLLETNRNSPDDNALEKFKTSLYMLPPALRTADNFNLLAFNEMGMTQNAYAVSFIFTQIPVAFRNTQPTLDRVIANAAAFNALTTDEANRLSGILAIIPEYLFTQNLINLIFNFIETNDAPARERILRDLRGHDVNEPGQALGEAKAENRGINYNPAQSTHKASVHKSVSDSAIALIECYGKQIDTDSKLDYVIDKFSKWVQNVTFNDLEDKTEKKVDNRFPVTEHQLHTAKRAIQWLAQPTTFFTDPTSEVSTRQLLAMIWLGVHDKEHCTTDITSAYRKIIVGLYDIQRGYNLNENFKESNVRSEDSKICTAGTFNKLMEILWGIHRLVNIKYITSEFASLKIKVLPQAVMKLYLNDLAQGNMDPEKRTAAEKMCVLKENGELSKEVVKENEAAVKLFSQVESVLSSFEAQKFYLTDPTLAANMVEDKKAIVELITEIRQDGISVVWDKILPVISTQMIDEYGCLYRGNSDDKFIGLVDGGQWVDVDKKFLNDLLIDVTAKQPSSVHLHGMFATGTETANTAETKPAIDEDKSTHKPGLKS